MTRPSTLFHNFCDPSTAKRHIGITLSVVYRFVTICFCWRHLRSTEHWFTWWPWCLTFFSETLNNWSNKTQKAGNRNYESLDICMFWIVIVIDVYTTNNTRHTCNGVNWRELSICFFQIPYTCTCMHLHFNNLILLIMHNIIQCPIANTKSSTRLFWLPSTFPHCFAFYLA